MSIVDSLRKLSLKLTGAYSTGEDIEDNIEFIAENYSGGGSGGGPIVFTANGTFDDQHEGWVYSLEDGTTFADIVELATAGDPMFLRVINQYNDGINEVFGVYPMSKIDYDYSESTPTVSAVEFGTTMMYELSPDLCIDYEGFKISSDGTVAHSQYSSTINNQ